MGLKQELNARFAQLLQIRRRRVSIIEDQVIPPYPNIRQHWSIVAITMTILPDKPLIKVSDSISALYAARNSESQPMRIRSLENERIST